MSNILNDKNDFPKAIVHVDGDAFFVGCELAAKPWLRGLPVVTGQERGIASALSYEAKAIGIRRGMSIKEIRQICPNVIVMQSDYIVYKMYSDRMVAIVKRYSRNVEHYSIDECFADITGMNEVLELTYEEIAQKIKNDLDLELGTTFSLGLSVSKVLAKCASKYKKPCGFTVIRQSEIMEFLKHIAVGKVWGIGVESSISLSNKKVFTAFDLVSKGSNWIKENYSKPIQEICAELNGLNVFKVDPDQHDTQKSLMCTRTFRPPSKDPEYVFSELSKNIEEACQKLRAQGLCTKHFSFFIKTRDFRYISREVRLVREISNPEVMIAEAKVLFPDMFEKNILYRTTGIRLSNLKPETARTLDLFSPDSFLKIRDIYKTVDHISNKFGRNTLFLASSFKAIRRSECPKKIIGIPSLGEVR